MKKVLLLCTSIALSICVMAQNESYPKGFKKAVVPSSMKRTDIKVPIRRDAVDNGEAIQGTPEVAIPLRVAPTMVNAMNDVTTIVGTTKYDLQTNNSVSNRIVWNADGSISTAWTFSPDANTTANPPYPFRGTGYNYFDGTNWLFAFPNLPTARTESTRTGFTNIVVTASGKEMTIAHQAVTGQTFNRILVNHRPVKGTGSWTPQIPWGSAGFDTWAKACGNVTGEYVYVIWHGSGAPATTTSPANIVNGQNGPLVFGRSSDGGDNWDAAKFFDELDSTMYCGFGGDSYGIDAKDNIVAITVGDTYTDIVLLKSTDYGNSWTKTIVYKHPIPRYGCTDRSTRYMYNDTIVDTIRSNAGDSKVIIDNNGMCHVAWSELDYHDGDSTDEFYNPHFGVDNLLYWNESMGPDTTTVWDTLTYGHGTYVAVAAAEDFSGNGQIDVPSDTFTTCTPNLPWGQYQTGITGMPSFGIDQAGTIYLTYQTINELADTTTWHMSHRHLYMIAMQNQPGIGYDPGTFSVPYNIIPSTAQGGDGENEECVFGTIARRVDNTLGKAIVLYQQDQVPGHSLATANTCEQIKNLNQINYMRICEVDITNLHVGVSDNLTLNDVQIGQNYPNPAGDQTNINVSLRKAADVKIEVADLLGKVVYSENKGKLNQGSHTITLNTASYAKGVYTYTVSTGDFKTTRKMIIK